MVFDPQELGFPLIEGSYAYGNGTFYFLLEDQPALYYQTYKDSYHTAFEEIIDRTSMTILSLRM